MPDDLVDEDADETSASEARETFVQWVSWMVLLCLIVFAVTNVLSDERWKIVRGASLLGLVVLVALWFIACFTGDAARNKRHGFVFAYAFTFGSFALLVTPLVAPQVQKGNDPESAAKKANDPESAEKKGNDRESAAKKANQALRPAEGALQLVRGCVAGGDGSVDSVSAVTRCPLWAEAPFQPSSAASGSTGVLAVQETGRQFAWLVSIGGVTVRKLVPQLTDAEFKPLDSFVEVYGGIAVPLFVVVLAFIGGAVSLSRRIPEYQRRSEKGYVPTANEPAMLPFQARESVVFQIMQLVSAPFLAMATWYIVSPTTIAVAAGLAFGTGFASEPLLLMIRGMVEGIRPAGSTSTPGTSTVNDMIDLNGVVLSSDGAPISMAEVLLSRENSSERRVSTTGEKGTFFFANVEPGTVHLRSTSGSLTAELTLTVTSKAPNPIELTLR